MTPLLLCAGLDAGKLMRLSFLASSMGIRVRAVQEKESGCTLGALCGVDANAQGSGRPLEGEMLVMAFFSDALMDQWLSALRRQGDTVALKAVLTPVNRYWTLARLYRELQKEHAAVHGQG